MSSHPSNNWGSSDQMKEVREFNASLTRAGQKSRPGRPVARGSGINRGGSGFAPGRPSNYGAQNMARPGSGVRVDPRMNYTVGPTTAQTIIRPSTVGGRARSRSPTRSASTPTTSAPHVGHYSGHYAVGSAPTHATHKPASPRKIRPSVLVADGSMPTEQAAAIRMPPIQQQHAGRERIVSNMTPNDPSKPWIPAHLEQKSAFEAIRHISKITGIRLERLTSDGVSIPAANPESRSIPLNAEPTAKTTGWPEWPESARVAPASAATTAATPAAPPTFTPAGTVQPTTRSEVDPNAWMAAYASKNKNKGGFIAQVPGPVTEPPRVASDSEMDVDMDDASNGTVQGNVYQVGTLEDSIWANAPEPTSLSTARSTSNGFQSQEAFGGATQNVNTFQQSAGFSAAARSTSKNFQSQQPFGGGMQNNNTSYNHTRNNVGSMENVKPAASGTRNQLNATNAMFTSGLVQALASSKPEKKLATLKDSRWA